MILTKHNNQAVWKNFQPTLSNTRHKIFHPYISVTRKSLMIFKIKKIWSKIIYFYIKVYSDIKYIIITHFNHKGSHFPQPYMITVEAQRRLSLPGLHVFFSQSNLLHPFFQPIKSLESTFGLLPFGREAAPKQKRRKSNGKASQKS